MAATVILSWRTVEARRASMLQETDIVMVIDSTYRSLRLQGTNENGCGDLAKVRDTTAKCQRADRKGLDSFSILLKARATFGYN